MRESFRYLAFGLSLMVLSGCGDTSTSPVAARPSAGAPSLDLVSVGDQSKDFVVTARGGSFDVAGFTVNFPANSVCDPTVSSYGEGEWDNACVTLAEGQSIRIKAKVRVTSAGAAVDFSPALRFNPNTEVTLSTDLFAAAIVANRDYYSHNQSALGTLAIGYSPFLGASAVADYKSDRSVRTKVNLSTGVVSRRIKHFSGYMMGSGEPCEPSPDNPDCIELDTRGGP